MFTFIQNYIIVKNQKIFFDDIHKFNQISSKSENDNYNKIRENILYIINNIPDCWLISDDWRSLQNNWKNVIKKISGTNNYTIEKIGGRKKKDFKITNNDNKNQYNIEFKFNNKDIEKIPQLMDLYIKNHIYTDISYINFFYDNYLNNICNICNITKPNFNIYFNNISKTNTKTIEKNNNISFFNDIKILKNSDEKIKNQLQQIVYESYKNYINIIYNNFDYKSLSNHLIKEKSNLYYLLYYNNDFYIDRLTISDLNIKKLNHIKETRTNILMYFQTESNKYHIVIRLCWKNDNGILGPAWKIILEKV